MKLCLTFWQEWQAKMVPTNPRPRNTLELGFNPSIDVLNLNRGLKTLIESLKP
jgi:hypothetical protein